MPPMAATAVPMTPIQIALLPVTGSAPPSGPLVASPATPLEGDVEALDELVVALAVEVGVPLCVGETLLLGDAVGLLEVEELGVDEGVCDALGLVVGLGSTGLSHLNVYTLPKKFTAVTVVFTALAGLLV